MIDIYNGDCLEIMKGLPYNSVDSIITDPPYGLEFMGKEWDKGVPGIHYWQEALRVLKPGGHLLSFGGTRTYHRMASAIEDAGFEIRDQIQWLYGSGFPKSLNIGKAVDKLQGNERENEGYNYIEKPAGIETYVRMGKCPKCEKYKFSSNACQCPKPKGNSEWEGWGTALKPANEPIVVARKPLGEKTVAENVLKYGTGGINIDGCRVATTDTYQASGMKSLGVMHDDNWQPKQIVQEMNEQGRFPANVIHDGSEEVVELFPNDSQRFFYCAKASKSERNKGLEGFEEVEVRGGGGRVEDGYDLSDPDQIGLKEAARKYGAVKAKKANIHPTVKPVALMQYLCRLVTPKGGKVLDPFMGSGTTGIGAKLEGCKFIGIEQDPDYCKIAEARISAY